MSAEGAMLGGQMLPQESFVKVMIDILQKNYNEIITSLDVIYIKVESKEIKEAYQEWQRLQTKIFGNPTVSLLTVLNFYNQEGSQTWTYVAEESDALLKGGQINMEKVGENLRKNYNSQILASHLSNLFISVQNDIMTKEEVNYLYSLKKSAILSRLNIIKKAKQTYIYKSAIYQSIAAEDNEVSFRGKVADAFLNHLGETHTEFLQNFLLSGQSLPSANFENKKVKDEENAKGRLNFTKLLLNSTNSTGWWTGGDLIITNSSGQVIANIQLKTSGNQGSSIGAIRTDELIGHIKTLRDMFKNQSELKKIAEYFYNMLKTSSVMSAIGDKVIEYGYDFVKQQLQIVQ